MSTSKKTGFFTLKDILAKNANVNLIISGRSNGKTYALCKYSLEQYKKNKKRFVYIRRWADDIKIANCQQLFWPLKEVVEDLWGPGYEITFWQKKFFLVDPNGEREIIGHAMALSESHHQKSVAYVDIGTIFFDEFIQTQGERILPDEKSRWENTLSTIIRFRTDIKVFLLANTVSKYGELLNYYRIPINQMKPGDIYTIDFPTEAGTLRVACEYAEVSDKISKKTSLFILDNTMITHGDWEIKLTDEIITTDGEVATEKLLFSAWEPTTEVNIACFVRTARYYTVETENFMMIRKPHVRQFLVGRANDKRSSYYHLTDIKDLTYGTWTSWQAMMTDIEDQTGISFMNELQHGRVYCDNQFTADFLYHVYQYYSSLKFIDLL